MNTYKLGNKITAVLRSFVCGDIGSYYMQYDKQPYTILQSVQANLTFANINSNIQTSFTQLAYNNSKISQIQISDVLLTDKILNLIYSKSEVKLFTKTENCIAEDNKIYINCASDKAYQVFIYNTDGELEQALGEHDVIKPIYVKNNKEDYLICYQYAGKNGYSLDKPNNQYFTLDLIIIGNKEDNTSNMTIHIDKCALRVDQNMLFNQRSNTVNLIFTVIDNGENYIALE